ncbi:MAG: AmmeMemoRadiSam system protein B [Candidatus Omnitrophota bacterium]
MTKKGLKDIMREAVVAGYFYPGESRKLKETILSFGKKEPPQDRKLAKGVILPHAGYDYSGFVAAQTVNSCELRNRLIILGPNHTGAGELFSVRTQGSWRTPLGDVPVDTEIASCLVEKSKYLKADHLAHDGEHCIEVLLPFLQMAQKDIRIVPIVVSQANNKKIYKDIAKDILDVIKELQCTSDVTIVASSDMTHYEPQEDAYKKDQHVIESILRLDSDNMLERVERLHVSMCGVVAVFILLEIVKGLGAMQADLIRYQTSGDTTGDTRSVVGYAGIRIT